MSAINILNLNGEKTNISEEKIEALRAQLRGPLVTAGDDGYDEARTIWNAMIDKKPALIARCAGAADVMRSVVFARDNNLLLAVRGGGHNIAGNAVCEGGFMIDLTHINHVHINPDARLANVGPGATLADFDHEAQAYALVTPLGINSTTGVAGLTLGGGFGWLSRKWALTVDNLVSADVVTAEGTKVRASADENTDLFWAIRGGGGNFGVVTNFEYKLHPFGPEALSGLIVYPGEEAGAVLRKYREFCNTAPADLTVWAVARKAPPLPFLPEDKHGQDMLALAILYAGDPAQGEKLIEPLHSLGTVWGAHVGVQPYAAWQQAFDPLLTPGVRNYWKSHNFADLSDTLIDTVVDYAGKVPSPHCEVFLAQVGAEANKVAVDATAYPARDANFVINVHGRWETAAEDDKCIAWAREFFDAATPHAIGTAYVNFMTDEEGGRVEAAYGANYARLLELKKKYDPNNLFRLNQNINPAG